MLKKVVIVNTSAAYLGEHPTGVWLEETVQPGETQTHQCESATMHARPTQAAPYYIFKEAGLEVPP